MVNSSNNLTKYWERGGTYNWLPSHLISSRDHALSLPYCQKAGHLIYSTLIQFFKKCAIYFISTSVSPDSHPIPPPWVALFSSQISQRRVEHQTKKKSRTVHSKPGLRQWIRFVLQSELQHNLPSNTLCRETGNAIRFLSSKRFAAWSKRKSCSHGRRTFGVNHVRRLSDLCPALLKKWHFAFLKKISESKWCRNGRLKRE